MTYGRWRRSIPFAERTIDAAVSHSAELVRGDFNPVKAPIRPFGAPSPQGEKGRNTLPQEKPQGRTSVSHR